MIKVHRPFDSSTGNSASRLPRSLVMLLVVSVSVPGFLNAQPPGADPGLPCGTQPFTPLATCSPSEGGTVIYNEGAPGDSVTYGPTDPPPWTPVVFDAATRTETILPIPPGYIDWDPGYEAYLAGSPGCAPDLCTMPGLLDIIGPDNRQHIANTTVFPWRAIGLVVTTFDDGSVCAGTGVLVGPRHLLTAAHIVHDRLTPGITDPWAQSLRFAPGQTTLTQAKDQPYGSAGWTNWFAWTGWTRATGLFGQPTPDENYDLMLIILDKPIGDKVGWFGLSTGGSDLNATRNLSGYPGDKAPGQQWWSIGSVEKETKHLLYYDNDTVKGTSGAPVWYWSAVDNLRYIRAVHSYSNVTNNVGVLLNRGKYDTIFGWIGQTSALSSQDECKDCPQAVPIPVLGPAWLAVLAFVVIGSGLLVLRRRPRTHTSPRDGSLT